MKDYKSELKTSRMERLARVLIKLYQCKMGIYNGKILITPSCNKDISAFPNWSHDTWSCLLFGDKYHASLNEALTFAADIGFQWAKDRKKYLLDFKTLDELDVQLTLAGANKT